MPNEQRPLKVFLCHAHSDRNAVRDLYQHLIEDGVDAWLDKEKLLPGQDWELEIRKAVRESDVVVVCLSTQFNQAGFRQKEVRLALDTAMEKPEGEIFIIPARLDECDTLDSLSKWRWVDLFDDDGYAILLRALRARAQTIGSRLDKKSVASSIPLLDRNKIPLPRNGDKLKAEEVAPRKLNPAVIVALIGLVGTLLAALISSPLFENLLPSSPSPTITLSIPTETAIPTTTATPAQTVTPTVVSSGVEMLDNRDVPVLLVPAGEFTMGSEKGDANESPVHRVYVDAFYMDKYEVTNALYKVCVEAGGCTPPQNKSSYTRSQYYGNSEFDNYPVIYVDWNQSNAYCEWRGGSLPTEAQWEKAAHDADGNPYPWGTGTDCNKANYWGNDVVCVGDTTSVGRYESGKDPYGIYDLAGNVWEWTADWYFETYYQESPLTNPLGPDRGQYRVLRGGAWSEYGSTLRASIRYAAAPDVTNFNLGFRCVIPYLDANQ
jgi:formylglycine-generating enzyme required for sulfatase activity